MQALNEGVISRFIGVPHDNARVSFSLVSVTVESWARFEDVIRERIVRSSQERYYKRATESPRPKLQPTQVPYSSSKMAKTPPPPNEAEFEYGSL